MGPRRKKEDEWTRWLDGLSSYAGTKLPPGPWHEHYAQTLASISHEDVRRWTLFGAFAAVQAILVNADAAMEFKNAGIAGLGVLVAFVSWVVIERNHAYLVDRTNVAIGLQRLLFTSKDPHVKLLLFYDEEGSIPKRRLLFDRRTGPERWAVEHAKAWDVMRSVIWTSAVLWGALLVLAFRPELTVTWRIAAAPILLWWAWVLTRPIRPSWLRFHK